MSETPTIAVIGIGNGFRSDDGAGLEVARLVRLARLENVVVVGGVSDDYALLTAWQDCDIVFIVDSTSSASDPGKIRTYDALSDQIPAEIFSSFSTHTLNILRTIELAGALGRLPQALTLMGIEGRNFAPGEGLTRKVETATAQVAATIISSCKSLSRVSR